MPRLSLAQQLAQLEDTAPVDFDPEALNPHGAEEEGRDVDRTAGREHYTDVGPSSLRKLADNFSDPKYDGVRTTRKSMLEQDEASDEDEAEDNDGSRYPESHSGEDSDDDFEGFGAQGPWSGEDDDEEDASEESEEENPRPSSTTEKPSPASPPTKRAAPETEEPSGDLTSTLKHAREADRRKGKAVAKQIALWDGLLDSRIRIQKAVQAANKLPEPSAITAFHDIPECSEALLKFSEEALGLAEDLFELQERLFAASGVDQPPRKRRKVDETSNFASIGNELVESSAAAAAFEEAYHPQLVQTLAKWSSKIQAVAPSVLLPSNKGTFSKVKQHLKSAVQLVDESMLDHSKLLSRTQLRRTPGSRISADSGEDAQGKEETEVFDDHDFYQKMLRAIIDSRGDGKGGADDWLAIQKQKKAKKNVDTKASKGRKLRYDVHEKIQNFMVPVPVVGAWHDEQIDELFSSLLGKGFENAGTADRMEVDNQQPVVVSNGFRVFG